MDRPQGAGKLPVDPATRLSELLAQSLDELTRPFDAPRPPQPQAVPAPPAAAPAPAAPPAATATVYVRAQGAAPTVVPAPPAAPPDQARIDADKALAELEAELFAAAKQVDRDTSIPLAEADETEPAAGEGDHHNVEVRDATSASDLPDKHFDQLERALMDPLVLAVSEKSDNTDAANDADKPASDLAMSSLIPPEPQAEPATPDAAASALVARVRRLMLISMAVTVIAVGSVFGFIGYRVMKGEGATAKTADKLPPAAAIPNDVTLSIPKGARVVQSAVTNDRLVLTLDIDGKIEVRTFDVKTLQPTGRLNFSATP